MVLIDLETRRGRGIVPAVLLTVADTELKFRVSEWWLGIGGETGVGGNSRHDSLFIHVSRYCLAYRPPPPPLACLFAWLAGQSFGCPFGSPVVQVSPCLLALAGPQGGRNCPRNTCEREVKVCLVPEV